MADGRRSFDAIERGREDLLAWEHAQPENWYLADDGLERALSLHLGAEGLDRERGRLVAYGASMAALDEAVRENNLHANLPRLETREAMGVLADRVVHHPRYHEIGRGIWADGPLAALGEPGSRNLRAFARGYLASMHGEAGHVCPLACTLGIVKVLESVASDDLRNRYLPRLLDPDYDRALRGAQFLTEVQGGSDVGANATVAIPDAAGGGHRLYGEKWFCSVVDADLCLMTARVEGAPGGTRGLGLFLVPLRDHGGAPLGHRVWRLKDKVGTRTMASAEIELDGAAAWHMGPEGQGFRNMMRYVIHTSRLLNALGCLGAMRRACVVAGTYARHRSAFGHPIARYPLVQDTLAAMRSDTAAIRAAVFHLAGRQDAIEDEGGGDPERQAAQRMAVNLNKTLSARIAHDVINQGIEVLGGNGTIETFSVLPRLLRDMVVFENWEGTHNTLFVQWLRDAKTRGMDEPFFDMIHEVVAGIGAPRGLEITALGARAAERLEGLRAEVAEMKALPDDLATLEVRRLGDRCCLLLYAACLLREAGFARRTERDDADDAELLALHFWARRIDPTSARRGPRWLDRIAKIAARL